MVKADRGKQSMTSERYWILTDLDGTLMDHNYSIKPAMETLNWIQTKRIPIIPCTSKTAAEVRLFRKLIGISDPYIVENGGAVYGENEQTHETWEVALGRTHNELRPLLDKLGERLGFPLKAFEDLPEIEITSITGLKGEAMKQAVERQWSVPFLNPPPEQLMRVKQLASDLELLVLQGNRMSHLLDKKCHKGKAVNRLKTLMGEPNVKIIALGDSPNDKPLLEVADFPIVVPGGQGPHPCFHKELQTGEFKLAPAAHGEGWAKAVRMTLAKITTESLV